MLNGTGSIAVNDEAGVLEQFLTVMVPQSSDCGRHPMDPSVLAGYQL